MQENIDSEVSTNDSCTTEGNDANTSSKTPDIKLDDEDIESTGNNRTQKVKNKEEVDTQYIINTLGSINYNNNGKEREFIDPTNELFINHEAILSKFPTDEIKKQKKKLDKERILLIDCVDIMISESALFELTNSYKDDHLLREVLFEGINIEQEEIVSLSFFEDKTRMSKITKKKPAVIVIRLNSESENFLGSMFCSYSYIKRIKKNLADNNIFLICIIQTEFIRDLHKQHTKRAKIENDYKPSFYDWHIDFLRYILHEKYSIERYEYLYNKIQNQKELGLWGDISEESFSSYIKQCITNKTLDEEVEKRITYVEGGNLEEFLKQINPPNEDLFPEDRIQRAVLYTAVFFPNLTTPEFNTIILLLLSNEFTITTTSYNKENEEVVKVENKEPLVNIWRKKADTIINECQLVAVSSNDGRREIRFTTPYLKSSIKKHLLEKNSFYINHQFTLIKNSGVLFESSTSNHIVNNIVSIYAEMALSDPNYYGENGLVEIIIKLQDTEDINESIVIFRLSKLIQELLQYPELRDIVKNFLNILMSEKYFNLVLNIVLGVTKRLRYTLDFDPMHWIQRLLNQAPKEESDKITKLILDLALQSGTRIYEYLDEIIQWLPSDNRHISKYPHSSLSVLESTIAYASYTYLVINTEDYGAWPPTYPLFSALQNDDNPDEKLKVIVSVIFHPALEEIIRKDQYNLPLDNDVNFSINTIIGAEYIEIWFLLLHGENEIHPKALLIAQALLRQVLNYTKKKQHRKIMNYWKQKINQYKQNDSSIYESTQYKVEIRSLLRLRKEFRVVQLLYQTGEN